MKDGDIVRYVHVAFVEHYKNPCWYFDSTNQVEKTDLVEVPYGTQILLGEARMVLLCVYPYVPYKGAKDIISVYKKGDLHE